MKKLDTKNILLTIDYELHFGSKTGTVKECMIDPTRKLMKLCSMFDCTMTIFWDILHYYKLMEFETEFPALMEDRKLIESQIKELVANGHDIQLHIHPHWLDAEYENSAWKFKYDRFSIHKLSKYNDNDGINSIIGCVKISKELMEKVVREVDPQYKVQTFRAGGYLIEPFDEISHALSINGVKYDSSVCPNLFNNNGAFSYNFMNYPDLYQYNFQETPATINSNGYFIELPVKTIRISMIIHIYFLILRKLKYRNLESHRKGTGSGSTVDKKKELVLFSFFKKIFKTYYNQLTSDSSFKEKYNYLLSKSENYSVQILHPKLLNDHMLEVMQDNLKLNKIKFTSIDSFLSRQ